MKKGKLFSKLLLRNQRESLEHTGTESKGKFNLTTKARRAVVGRNKQLYEGADTGRQTWKYHNSLNCVAWLHLESMAHGCKHGPGI